MTNCLSSIPQKCGQLFFDQVKRMVCKCMYIIHIYLFMYVCVYVCMYVCNFWTGFRSRCQLALVFFSEPEPQPELELPKGRSRSMN